MYYWEDIRGEVHPIVYSQANACYTNRALEWMRRYGWLWGLLTGCICRVDPLSVDNEVGKKRLEREWAEYATHQRREASNSE